ncbi:unnamed protein product [Lampetra fluviatilis]
MDVSILLRRTLYKTLLGMDTVADGAAVSPATPGTEPDTDKAPGLPTPGLRHRLHVEQLRLREEPAAVMAQPLMVCAGAAMGSSELEEPGSLAAVAAWPLASLPCRPETGKLIRDAHKR